MTKDDATPLISIIVPVYNVETYLEQCLQSLAQQTLKNIEIICINDGSTDSSTHILKKYAKTDKRFIVIMQDNKGVSTARNIGIQHAQGKYLGFVDADDYVADNMYAELWYATQNETADIVECGAYVHNESDAQCDADWYHSYLEAKSIQSEDLGNDKWGEMFAREEIRLYVWNKIFRRELIMNHHINYPQDCRVGEDMIFTIMSIAWCHKYATCKQKLYHYRLCRKDSATNASLSLEERCHTNFNNIESIITSLTARDNSSHTAKNLFYCVNWLTGWDIHNAQGHAKWQLLSRLELLYRQLNSHQWNILIPPHMQPLLTALKWCSMKRSYRAFLSHLRKTKFRYAFLSRVTCGKQRLRYLKKKNDIQTELKIWKDIQSNNNL